MEIGLEPLAKLYPGHLLNEHIKVFFREMAARFLEAPRNASAHLVEAELIFLLE
jgi:hypothetical protein